MYLLVGIPNRMDRAEPLQIKRKFITYLQRTGMTGLHGPQKMTVLLLCMLSGDGAKVLL